jgi:hypothetical protein
MGFGIGASQCLVAPPYVFAGFVMFGTAWFADKYHTRGPILAFNSILCLIGIPMMGFAQGNATRYAGVFFVTAGANANIPAAMAYQANNVRGQWTRALSSATLVGFGGIGGIASSLVFRAEDAPGYRPGMYATIAYVEIPIDPCFMFSEFEPTERMQMQSSHFDPCRDLEPVVQAFQQAGDSGRAGYRGVSGI